MRILFDARSVRTTTGSYILQGLTSSWRRDERVAAIFAAVPAGADTSNVPADLSVVRLPAGAGWVRHVTVALPRAADSVGADVIFCANGTGPSDRRTVLYFQDLFHFHSRGLPLRGRLMEAARAAWRWISASDSGLGVAVSRTIADDAKQKVGGLTVVEIPNGVEVDSARWSGERDVVYVAGGTGSRKSEETAVRAWARVRRRGATILEIGGVEPAGRRAELQRLVTELGLGDAVRVCGALPRLAYLERMARARLTVSCSRLESFGLPVAEALVMGAPVICSDLPAHRELLARAGAGECFPIGEDTLLAEGIERALDGRLPARLTTPPVGWDWSARGREHIDAYQRYLGV